MNINQITDYRGLFHSEVNMPLFKRLPKVIAKTAMEMVKERYISGWYWLEARKRGKNEVEIIIVKHK